MSHSYFDKQDIFMKKMIEDYETGLISNPIFKPYFDWKMRKTAILQISKQEARSMKEAADLELDKYYDQYPEAFSDLDSVINDDPWQHYKGFGEDKYIVSYLEAIEEEINQILMMGTLK